MADAQADTVVILSSELISKITEEYFNKTMFKQKVSIVDSKPTEAGYMFSIAFVPLVKNTEPVMVIQNVQQASPMSFQDVIVERFEKARRDKNGKFTKVVESEV